MANEYYSGGLYRAQFWLRDSAGYFNGDQTTWANAATTHSTVLDGIVETDLQIADLVTQPIRGGNSPIAYIQFGNTSLNPFTMTFETNDADHVALMQGTSVDVATNSSFEIWTHYANAANFRSAGLIITEQGNDRDGAAVFLHTVIPYCQIAIRRVLGGYQAVNTFIWRVTPISTLTNYDGKAFSAWGLNVPGNRLDHYLFKTSYPIAVSGLRSDAIATTFITQYKPISSTITLAATPNWFGRNGAYQALSSISTTTGVATMAAAGTAADKNILTYQTNLVSV